jgi:ubiquitin
MISSTSNSLPLNNTTIKSYQSVENTFKSTPKSSSEKNNLSQVTDQVNISYGSENTTIHEYDMSLEQTAGDGFDMLRGLVLSMFKEQGIEYKIPVGDSEINLETITPEEAGELVADDGYFGVEKTAERIFNFAVGIAGGDVSRLDAIKEGLNQGFQAAEDVFGGTLPDISYETYDAVISKLDEWADVENSPES